jgi:hypothetical protein
MDERKTRLQTAVDAILPIVETLSHSEWIRLSGLINRAYTSKAAKVTLDGSDVKTLHRSIQSELLGVPLRTLLQSG